MLNEESSLDTHVLSVEPRGDKLDLGVTAEDFQILNRRVQTASVRGRLLIVCHNVDYQARNHGVPLGANLIHSVDNLDIYFVWISKLAADERHCL